MSGQSHLYGLNAVPCKNVACPVRRRLDLDNRDFDRGDIRVQRPIIGLVRERVGTEETWLRRVGEGAVGFEGDGSVHRIGDHNRRQRFTVGAGVVG